MKRYILLSLVLLMPSLLWAKSLQYQPSKGLGENNQGKVYQTHAVPKEFPEERTPLYNVTVNGSYVGLYNDRNFWGGLVHFGSFEFEDGKEVTIHIAYYRPIKTYEILPIHQLDLVKVKQTSENSLLIKMKKADQNITLVVNGELEKHVLHLFCNSIDKNAPHVDNTAGYHKYDDQKLYYFGPGYYDLKQLIGNDMLIPEQGWRVYVAAGAVLYGRIGYWGSHRGSVLDGRGMVYNDTRRGRVILEANNCEGLEMKGLLFHCHRGSCWQVVLNHCKDIRMDGVKILSTRYASTDGLDVVNCEDCIVSNTFIRSSDDAIAVKGLGDGKPADNPPSRNLTFSGMQLWNDCNCAMGIGAENLCSLYENIKFEKSSILFSRDDPDYHDVMDERAAMTICCIHGTYFRNICYEDIDVYHADRLIAAGFQPNFWFGYHKGDQTTEGGISGLTYRNIRSFKDSGSLYANKIHLYGWKKSDGTPDKYVSGVVMQGVEVEGNRLVSKDSPYFSETDWNTVRDFQIQSGSTSK